MKWNWVRGSQAAIILAALSWPALSLAAEPVAPPQAENETEETKSLAEEQGDFWIGVQANPMGDEALLSHLGLKQGLIVAQVLKDSPAAKAGVQNHDVLLRWNDVKLTDLRTLLQAVNATGEEEATLVVVRQGKEESLKLKPAPRPEDVLIEAPQKSNELRVFRFMGPGVADARVLLKSGPAFPNGVSLTVTKENDQPAKIVVKKEGKTYETTEDRLDVLPAEIRVHASRLFAGREAVLVSPQTMFPGQTHSDVKVRELIANAQEHAVRVADEQSRQHQAVKSRVLKADEGTLEAIKKELQSLRKDVERLKKQSLPEKKAKEESSQDQE